MDRIPGTSLPPVPSKLISISYVTGGGATLVSPYDLTEISCKAITELKNTRLAL
jgi:hypothetical protein